MSSKQTRFEQGVGVDVLWRSFLTQIILWVWDKLRYSFLFLANT